MNALAPIMQCLPNSVQQLRQAHSIAFWFAVTATSIAAPDRENAMCESQCAWRLLTIEELQEEYDNAIAELEGTE